MDQLLTIENGNEYPIDHLPEECPRCHKAIAAIPRKGGLYHESSSTLQALFQCPSCKSLFLAQWKCGQAFCRLLCCEPNIPIIRSFELINSVSEQFAIIFNQAAAAESFGLDQIAGLGYRKALEFLIKDYCVWKHPEDEQAIKSEFLGAVIAKRIEDTRIQRASEKAAWLGNDETHYVRVWKLHDVEDLKKLLEITIRSIETDIQYEDYETTMVRRTQQK